MSNVQQFWDELMLRTGWGAQRRNGWGDRSAHYPLPYVFFHHDAAGEMSANATVEQEIARMHLLERIGFQRFGGSVSYQLVVFPSGRAYQGLGFSRVGAHTKGYNTLGIAIALVGNYESKRPTAAQERTIARALEAMHAEGIIRQPRITHGHRNVFPTSCPGNAAHARIGAINALVGKTGPATRPAATRPAQTTSAPTPTPVKEGTVMSAEDVWRYTGRDFVNENPQFKDTQVARTYQYAQQTRAEVRELKAMVVAQSKSLDKLLKGNGEILKAVEDAERQVIQANAKDVAAELQITTKED